MRHSIFPSWSQHFLKLMSKSGERTPTEALLTLNSAEVSLPISEYTPAFASQNEACLLPQWQNITDSCSVYGSQRGTCKPLGFWHYLTGHSLTFLHEFSPLRVVLWILLNHIRPFFNLSRMLWIAILFYKVLGYPLSLVPFGNLVSDSLCLQSLK